MTDWKVIALVIGAGVFAAFVCMVFASAARLAERDETEGFERPEYRDMCEVPESVLALPGQQSLPYFLRIPPYVPGVDEDVTGPLSPDATGPMQAWELPRQATLYESERAQLP